MWEGSCSLQVQWGGEAPGAEGPAAGPGAQAPALPSRQVWSHEPSAPGADFVVGTMVVLALSFFEL